MFCIGEYSTLKMQIDIESYYKGVVMAAFTFGKHAIHVSDIHEIKLACDYQKSEMFIDLKLNGDIQLSLNLHDSLLFMKNSFKKLKKKKCTM